MINKSKIVAATVIPGHFGIMNGIMTVSAEQAFHKLTRKVHAYQILQ